MLDDHVYCHLRLLRAGIREVLPLLVALLHLCEVWRDWEGQASCTWGGSWVRSTMVVKSHEYVRS